MDFCDARIFPSLKPNKHPLNTDSQTRRLKRQPRFQSNFSHKIFSLYFPRLPRQKVRQPLRPRPARVPRPLRLQPPPRRQLPHPHRQRPARTRQQPQPMRRMPRIPPRHHLQRNPPKPIRVGFKTLRMATSACGRPTICFLIHHSTFNFQLRTTPASSALLSNSNRRRYFTNPSAIRCASKKFFSSTKLLMPVKQSPSSSGRFSAN